MKEYILEVKKLLTPSFCEKIISYHDNNLEEAQIVSGINKNTRNCLTKHLHEPKSLGEKILLNAIKEKIFDCVNVYKEKFFINITSLSQIDFLKYETNDFDAGYKFHCDYGINSMQRHLSISICLNNNYRGGEFVFQLPSSDQFVIPQNEGDALIFPSNFMFPHQVNKITSGTRYALIGWVY